MVSLYEYLGKAAGSNLGLAVAKVAHEQGIEIGQRQVHTGYGRPINTYPMEFLNSIFNPDGSLKQTIIQTYHL